MPKLLLNLRLATEEEAAEVCELLDQHGVDWYQTQPGFWGISAGGIWLRDLERAAEVKALLDTYQQQRSIRVRAALAAEREAGTALSFMDALRAAPLRMLTQLLAALLLIALTIGLPFALLSR